MSWKQDLDFAKETTETNGYSSGQKIKSKNFQEYVSSLLSSCAHYLTASNHDGDHYMALYLKDIQKHHVTMVVNRALLKKEWLLSLDCDGIPDKDMATRHLNGTSWGQNYFVIQSSPGRFWIICDYIGSIKEVTKKLDEIPGVDPLFVNCCKDKKFLNLRGYPKNGFVPIFDDMRLLDTQHASVRYRKWVRNFNYYWYSEEMTTIAGYLREVYQKDNPPPEVVEEMVGMTPFLPPVSHCLDRYEV